MPTPTVEATGSTAVQLTDATVMCTVTKLSNQADMTNVTVMWASDGLFPLVNRTNTSGSSVVTDSQTIPMISIANAGVYRCSAFESYVGTNDEYVEDSDVSVQDDATVNVTS